MQNLSSIVQHFDTLENPTLQETQVAYIARDRLNIANNRYTAQNFLMFNLSKLKRNRIINENRYSDLVDTYVSRENIEGFYQELTLDELRFIGW